MRAEVWQWGVCNQSVHESGGCDRHGIGGCATGVCLRVEGATVMTLGVCNRSVHDSEWSHVGRLVTYL